MAVIVSGDVRRAQQHPDHPGRHAGGAGRETGGVRGLRVRALHRRRSRSLRRQPAGRRFNVHVPFYIGAATVALAAVVLSTVHRALAAADRGETAQPELDDLDRVEREDEMQVSAGIGNVD